MNLCPKYYVWCPFYTPDGICGRDFPDNCSCATEDEPDRSWMDIWPNEDE